MKTVITSALLLLTTTALAVVNVQAATPSEPVPATFFGMHTMQAKNWPTIPVGALGKAPGTLWPMVERSKGNFDWKILDDYVNTTNNHNISFTYSPLYVPKWAASNLSSCTMGFYNAYVCTSGVTNIQDWKDFMTALVTRYVGRIKVYELWMEPQNHFTGTMAELVAMTNVERDIIKAIDPNATIISPSMVSYGAPYLDQYFAAGGTKNVDAIAMHAYPNPNKDVAEFIVGSVTTSIQTVMQKYGLSSKPLWDTETSWGQTNTGAITDPDLQAAFVARNFFLHWSMGITRAYWYAWDNTLVGLMWTPTTGINKPGIAFEQTYKWMVGATMTTCSPNGSTSFYDAIYTCDLSRSGGYRARAVWNTDGNSTYTAPSYFTQYRDLDGQSHTIPSNHQVTIGLKPILLEAIGSADGSPLVFETESLAATTSGAPLQVIGSSSFSGLQGTLLAATASGASVSYSVNVPAAGTYNVRVAVSKLYNRGQFQLAINGVNQAGAQDGFSSSSTTAELDLGSVTISSAGQMTFKFTVIGKNAQSSDYRLAFDCIKLIP